jgi:mono/diheme cytochrome c family protein
MFRGAPLVLMGAAFATVAAANGDRYHIGRPATSEEIEAAGTSVAPDGRGLPDGRGNAIEGRSVYESTCAGCHGAKGEGSPVYPALAGGRGTLKSNDPVLTVGSYWPYATTVWDYINRAMPYTNPGSLAPSQVYAVTAYVLFMNGIIDKHAELNKSSLPNVLMPNRNGFTRDPRPDAP